MYVLVANTPAGNVYYTGKAGVEWTSLDSKEAFEYSSKIEACRKEQLFNGRTALHGLTFFVKEN